MKKCKICGFYANFINDNGICQDCNEYRCSLMTLTVTGYVCGESCIYYGHCSHLPPKQHPSAHENSFGYAY